MAATVPRGRPGTEVNPARLVIWDDLLAIDALLTLSAGHSYDTRP
jgi:hypothetical protein